MDGWTDRIPWSHASPLKGEIWWNTVYSPSFCEEMAGKIKKEKLRLLFLLSFFWNVHIDLEIPFFNKLCHKKMVLSHLWHLSMPHHNNNFFFGIMQVVQHPHSRGRCHFFDTASPQKVSPIENVTRIESLELIHPLWDTLQGPLLALSCLWAQWEPQKKQKQKNLQTALLSPTKKHSKAASISLTTLEMEGKQF